MPIINCYTKNINLLPEEWDRLVDTWARQIGITRNDITIHIIQEYLQIGALYDLKIELYLPSLWSDEAVTRIQESFLELIEKNLGIKQTNIFLMTQIIQSGHVIDRGEKAEW